MQQLNVLPISASKNVEKKDESAAFISTSSKDEFSQHIDLHLAKNKDVSSDRKRDVADKPDENNIETLDKNSTVKSDEITQQNADDYHTAVDETNSATSVQDVAASGKKPENALDKEKSEIQPLEESELLMSFLNKADKTLIDTNPVDNDNISTGDVSAAQKALKLNLENGSDKASEQAPVVTSKGNKANQIDENTLVELDELESKASNNLKDKSLIQESVDKPHVSINNKKATANLLSNDKNISTQQLNIAKSVEESAVNNLTDDNNKITESTLTANNQTIMNKDLADKISSKALNKVNEELTQKELNKQPLKSENKSNESNTVKLTSTPIVNAQATTNSQSPLDIEARVNEQITQLAQNTSGISKQDASLAAAISAAQNNQHSKNLSVTSLEQASTETAMKESDLVNTEDQLKAKAADHLIEQNKAPSNKASVITTTNFPANSNFIDMTGTSTQAAQERVAQHAAEIFNPIGSSEVSQGQKTNTQLHQETISIFRRDFADAVKDKVMLMISQKLQQFDITLDPPELGNMHVRVNLQGEQAIVNFVVQNQQAKEAFEQNMHKLKELLAERGVDVGDANVEQQSQQSDHEENNNENSENSNRRSIINTVDASDAIEHNLSARMINSATTAVDYYA